LLLRVRGEEPVIGVGELTPEAPLPTWSNVLKLTPERSLSTAEETGVPLSPLLPPTVPDWVKM